jgi:hypothetical protein
MERHWSDCNKAGSAAGSAADVAVAHASIAAQTRMQDGLDTNHLD